ncbi:MAG: endonuclease/exonuclease/phosphatase family protein [Bacteroidetes bacterium]|nr:endonuclease/exonuclease/phosphatase family protein [Bacteroidota bacterium]
MKKFNKILLDRQWYLAMVILVVTCILIVPTQFYLLMIIQSFSIQIIIGFFMLSLIYIFKRSWMLSFGFALGAIVLSIAIQIPALHTNNNIAATDADIKIAHYNVLTSNRHFDKTIQSALRTGADFISFQEVSYKWQTALTAGLSEEYPFHKIESKEGTFGIAVFSKYELKDVLIYNWGGIPHIAGIICAPKGEINFLASHLSSPTLPRKHKNRNVQMQDMATYLHTIDGPKLAIGDYNTVPWDSAMNKFRRQTKMQDSRKDLSTTYPSWSRILRIPIDYIFHSNELRCISFSTINDTSSDHFGIIGNYNYSKPNS